MKILGVAMLVAFASACASATGEAPSGTAGNNYPAQVEVTNLNWHDVRVFLVRSDTRVRLGTVISMSTETISVPHSILATGDFLQLEVNPIALSASFRTHQFAIEPGDLIEFRIQNNLEISTVRLAN